MLELSQFAEYGVAIFSIATLGVVVCWIVKFLGGIIKNDLRHIADAMNRMADKDSQLKEVIDRLLDYLKNHK